MLPLLAVYPRFFPKQRPCRLAFMADKVVMIAICSARNVPQDSSRDHRGAESVIIERQQSAAGPARRQQLAVRTADLFAYAEAGENLGNYALRGVQRGDL